MWSYCDCRPEKETASKVLKKLIAELKINALEVFYFCVLLMIWTVYFKIKTQFNVFWNKSDINAKWYDKVEQKWEMQKLMTDNTTAWMH